MKYIKLMADYQCYPIWNMSPGEYGDMAPCELPISKELQERLLKWASIYDETLDSDYPPNSGFKESNRGQTTINFSVNRGLSPIIPTGDDGGHLIASSLGGAGDKINIGPQASTLNRRDWRAMENSLRKDLEAGKSVSVKVEVKYPPGDGIRPSEFKVYAMIDGELKQFTFVQ